MAQVVPSNLQVGGLPVIQDYESYADMASFQERLNYHCILNTNVHAGLYYIGVYNNDAYFKVGKDDCHEEEQHLCCWRMSKC